MLSTSQDTKLVHCKFVLIILSILTDVCLHVHSQQWVYYTHIRFLLMLQSYLDNKFVLA
jgi:hypothetical protein